MNGTETYRLWVAELSDEAAPRVHPDKPNLYVGVTIEDPVRRFDHLIHSWRPKHLVARYGVKLRRDLSEQLPAYADRAAATEAEKGLIKGLRRQGLVVNGVSYRYRIYVILLKDAVGPRKCPDKPWIYVGQTRKDVKARFREHTEGARNGKGPLYSPIVYRYGVRLMPELYESIPCAYALACFIHERAR
jgi:predicted GIY-YIG superfamily endonuclease